MRRFWRTQEGESRQGEVKWVGREVGWEGGGGGELVEGQREVPRLSDRLAAAKQATHIKCI